MSALDALGLGWKDAPEISLTVFAMLLTAVVALAALFRRPRDSSDGSVLAAHLREVLESPVVSASLKESGMKPDEFIASVAKALREETATRTRPTTIMGKISSDITWDVSGLIGILVTIVLLFAVVSRSSDSVPKEIFAGWTTILGFYFGKATR